MVLELKKNVPFEMKEIVTGTIIEISAGKEHTNEGMT